MFHRIAHQLGESEIEFEDYLELSGQSQDAFLEDLRSQATRKVQTDVLLYGVAEDAGIEVTADELSEAYEVLSVPGPRDRRRAGGPAGGNCAGETNHQ